MKLNNLKPAAGSTHSRRRIGRGPGSGLGGTSTRGHKGAKARSGYKRKIGFEGGQMPLQRRVPKAGFKNINHKEYFAVNLSTLQKLAEAKNLTVIGIEELKAAHLTNGKELVKVLGNGELTAKLEVKAHAFSKTAEEAIKAVGGNTTTVNLSTLQKLAEAKNLTVIGIEELKAAHLTNGKELVKVLGNGELTAKLEVKAHAFSKTAEEAPR